MSLTVGCNPTVAKTTARTRSATVAETATVTRSKPTTTTATLAETATISRQTAATKTSTALTAAATATRAPAKPLPIIISPVATVTRGNVTPKLLAATVKAGEGLITQALNATVAAVASLSAILQRPRTLTTTAGEAATVAKQTVRPLPTGSQMTLPPILQSVAAVPSLTAIKNTAQVKILAAISVLSPRVTRTSTHPFTTSQTSTVSITKRSPSLLTMIAHALADLADQKVAKLSSLSATQPDTATISRQAAPTLEADTPTTAAVKRTPARVLPATVTPVAVRGTQIVARLLQIAQATFATRQTQTSSTHLTTEHSVASVAAPVTRPKTLTSSLLTRIPVLGRGYARALTGASAPTAHIGVTTPTQLTAAASTNATFSRSKQATLTTATTAIAHVRSPIIRLLSAVQQLRGRLETDHPLTYLSRRPGRIGRRAAGRARTDWHRDDRGDQ